VGSGTQQPLYTVVLKDAGLSGILQYVSEQASSEGPLAPVTEEVRSLYAGSSGLG
jgi:hypothetical protein